MSRKIEAEPDQETKEPVGTEEALELFRKSILDRGCKAQTAETAVRRVKRIVSLLGGRYTAMADITADDLAYAAGLLNMTDAARNRYMMDTGAMVELLTGSNPYHDYVASGDPGMRIRRRYQKEFALMEKRLRKRKLTDNTIQNSLSYASTALSEVLRAYPGITFEDMGPEQIGYLRTVIPQKVRYCHQTYYSSFGYLVEAVTGSNPLHQERAKKGTEARERRWFVDFEFGPQMKSYHDWMIEHGFHDATVFNRMYGIIYAFNLINTTLAQIHLRVDHEAVVFDVQPEEITGDMLYKVQANQTQVRQNTCHEWFIDLSGFLKYTVGKSPLGDSMIRWESDYKRAYFLTDAQWTILTNVATETEMIILMLGGLEGLRRAEMAHLKKKDVGRFDITIRGKGRTAKGKVVERPMNEVTRSYIDRYLIERKRIIKQFGDHSEGYLIIHPSGPYAGHPMTPEQLGGYMTRLSRRTGIRFHTHMLRRLYAMDMLHKSDGDIVKTAILMRHSEIDTTMKHYINRNEAAIYALKDAANAERVKLSGNGCNPPAEYVKKKAPERVKETPEPVKEDPVADVPTAPATGTAEAPVKQKPDKWSIDVAYM